MDSCSNDGDCGAMSASIQRHSSEKDSPSLPVSIPPACAFPKLSAWQEHLLGTVETLSDLNIIEGCDGSSWPLDPAMLSFRLPLMGSREDVLSRGLCSVVPVPTVVAVPVLLTACKLP